MFTGLIENIGIVTKINPRENYLQLMISPEPMFENLKIGESIAVSGPCLTVIAFDEKIWGQGFIPLGSGLGSKGDGRQQQQ